MKPSGSPEKARIIALARDTLPALKPGERAYFELPSTQPGRCALRGCIQVVAWAVFGVGKYSMKSDAGGVAVTGLAP